MSKETKDKPLTKKQEVDIALHTMVMNSKPGTEFTYQEISHVCGLSHERVRQIEIGALSKVKKMLAKIAAEDGVETDVLF
jgi:DNA-directed RNA polymerase sigma subunit (sigma70/sigma32)